MSTTKDRIFNEKAQDQFTEIRDTHSSGEIQLVEEDLEFLDDLSGRGVVHFTEDQKGGIDRIWQENFGDG